MQFEYEIVIVIRPDLDDAITTGIVEKIEGLITESSGRLIDRDDWGKRKLAYLIEKHARGHYFLLVASASPTLILEIERRLRIDERVLRFLTVKIGAIADIEARIQLAAEKRKAKEEARLRGEYEDLDADGDIDEDEDGGDALLD